jgi:hypothetical protein
MKLLFAVLLLSSSMIFADVDGRSFTPQYSFTGESDTPQYSFFGEWICATAEGESCGNCSYSSEDSSYYTSTLVFDESNLEYIDLRYYTNSSCTVFSKHKYRVSSDNFRISSSHQCEDKSTFVVFRRIWLPRVGYRHGFVTIQMPSADRMSIKFDNGTVEHYKRFQFPNQ